MKTLGISEHKLAILNNVNGSVMHALKKSDSGFRNFGEIYFSNIKYRNIKAWKRHTKMTMNLVVPVGRVKFVFYSEEKNIFEEYILGENNYNRLTVNPL